MIACPNSHFFGRILQDCGGFYPSIKVLHQRADIELPFYVPVIHHRFSRGNALDESIVALPTARVIRILRHHPEITPIELRAFFRVTSNSRILLVSVAQDRELERIWRDLIIHRFPESLSRLGIEHITSPNFSIPDDLPRTEGIANISRIVKISEALSRAGLSVIPHLNATHERQWNYWQSFLREHNHVTLVAKEFQTGLAPIKAAKWHLAKLAELQQRIGRGIHLCAVGGGRHLQHMPEIRRITIVDSRPFFQTVHRRVLIREKDKWELVRTERGSLLDGRLTENITSYRQYIREKFEAFMNPNHTQPPLAANLLHPDSPPRKELPVIQGTLWPDLVLKEIA